MIVAIIVGAVLLAAIVQEVVANRARLRVGPRRGRDREVTN